MQLQQSTCALRISPSSHSTMPDVTPNTETLCAKCRGFNARQEVQTVTTLLNGVHRNANR